VGASIVTHWCHRAIMWAFDVNIYIFHGCLPPSP
jgi:hypothetical protein